MRTVEEYQEDVIAAARVFPSPQKDDIVLQVVEGNLEEPDS